MASAHQEILTATLFVQFQIGADCYALEARQVMRILPLLEIKHIPGAPRGVAGVLNYRGSPVPAIDLSELALGRPAPRCLSTRVIVVNLLDGSGHERPLGLIAEKVTDTLRRERSDFVPAGVTSEAAPYVGAVAAVGGRLLQLVDVRQLLPPRVRDALYRELEVGA